MLVLPLISTVYVSCSNESTTTEMSVGEDDESADMENDETDSERASSDTVQLVANADIIKNNGEGEQLWNDDVFLTAKKINGATGKVVFESRFRDDGFGVAGGRWQQIDYYYEYQGEVVKASEQLIVNFRIPVTDVQVQVGQMDPGEGRQAKEGTTCDDNDTNRADESGQWKAYNAAGEMVASGILLDEYSVEGKLPDSMGSYRFQLDAKNVSKIVLEATQWGGEERGCPTYRSSYASQALNDSGNTENNSEFNLMALSYRAQ